MSNHREICDIHSYNAETDCKTLIYILQILKRGDLYNFHSYILKNFVHINLQNKLGLVAVLMMLMVVIDTDVC